jgi:hypothetical protein
MASRRSAAQREVHIFTGVELHSGQYKVYDHPARFKVLACGRRWGKTVYGENWLSEGMAKGEPVAFMSTSYKNLDEFWEDMKRIFADAIVEKDEQQKSFKIVGGGSLICWSLDNPDAIRGKKYARVVIDEAAFLKNGMSVWSKIIRATLMDLTGSALFLSTPNGYNWFWTMFSRGDDPLYPDFASFQMPTATNPHIRPTEIEAMRRELSDREFREEILAEFISGGGAVFRNVKIAATARPQVAALPGHFYVFGVDPARDRDFTVITVIDMSLRELCFIDRFNSVEYQIQEQRIVELAARFKPISIVVERNSSIAFVEALERHEELPIHPFQTSATTKQAIIQHLENSFDKWDSAEGIKILNDDVLLGELMSFQSKRTDFGFKYGAPSGSHDDCVMSLALGWYGATYNAFSWADAEIA